MRITERRLRRLIRKVLRESKPLISEALKKGFQIVDKPTTLNMISTDVKEFCPPSMMYDYDTFGFGILCDMTECQFLIAALYIAEKQGIDVPNLKAKIVVGNDGNPAIQVSVLGPISEDFVKLFNEIEEESQGRTSVGPYGSIRNRSLNSRNENVNFMFSPEDNVRIINSTTVMN